MVAVKECPCCGKPGRVKKSQATGLRRGWVGCPECGLYIQWVHDPDGAIAKWNRRNAPEANND